MEIAIRVHRKFSSPVNKARLGRIVRRTLVMEKERRDVTIYITTDSEIRLLNRKFHATNAPTDVLSFHSRLGKVSVRGASATKQTRTRMENGTPKHAKVANVSSYLGDVVISYDRARVQARDAHWRVADELDLLVVHGVLHLVGYDDSSPDARKKMWKRQQDIFGKKEIL